MHCYKPSGDSFSVNNQIVNILVFAGIKLSVAVVQNQLEITTE